ncbi:MAG: selenocysteine-specific translation elongation factor [Christensenellaceae bacterium]|jgi:selenocysteine-specific elongation factor|nr:selenocysteine-specific translation elongation factor [Christensenellaceae bacterium]
MNAIIGTAGHVDHGKTLLVKALTGIDTDRLKEEKQRGITIELGFAYLNLPDGGRAGIVDVPGHEKFIKNMLAGAGGIDLAMLVVAADDGVMPQTIEHLGILDLLGIERGLIVITKVDLVEQDWLELIRADIQKAVEGTFLQGAPILEASAVTGQGIEPLRALLFDLVAETRQKKISHAFRLPVDRVFSVEGHGTVLTGTLIEGAVSIGEEAELYPSGLRLRVRNLQVHSNRVETAESGQRVAVNLAGLKKDEAARGDTLALPGSMQNTQMLDVRLRVLSGSEREIKDGSRLHFYHGAREVLCKVALLEQSALGPGQEGYAQLRFTEKVAAKKGDRFVVRFYSPLETVGGGIVLNANPARHRRHDAKVLESLRVREQGSPLLNLLQAVEEGSPRLVPLEQVRKQLAMEAQDFARELDTLRADGSVIFLTQKTAVSKTYAQALERRLCALLREYHAQNRLQAGMRRDELRGRLLPGAELALADKLLMLFAEGGANSIRFVGQRVALADFHIEFDAKDKKLAEDIAARFAGAPFAPPTPEEAIAAYPKDKAAARQVFEALTEQGALVMAGQGVCFHRDAVAQARGLVQAHFAAQAELTLAQFRDMLGTSRKYALPLLEYFDDLGYTKKLGEARLPGGKLQA